tara:strand:+ start:352 stop:777 length:426 start_codon:yes stop_codon:yes gene_type:complete
MKIQDDYSRSLQEIYDSFPEKTQEPLDQDIKLIWGYFIAWGLFTLLALGSIVYLVLLNPFNESFGIWFQRSGSLISLIAVLTETVFIIKLSKLVNISHPVQLTYEIYLFRRFKSLLNLSIFITAILLFVGTIIWGYGDLLF